MSFQATPDQLARHRATLDELGGIGLQFSRILHDLALRDDADHHALATAFTDVARSIRRGIILSCSLEHLVRAGSKPEPQRRAPAELAPAEAAPRAERRERAECVERGDRLDTLDRLGRLPDGPVDALVAGIERQILAAAASVLDIPRPRRPGASRPQPDRRGRHAPAPHPVARRTARC